MKVIKKEISEVLLFSPKIFNDERGFFLETFRKSIMKEFSIPEFIQHNHSRSSKGVLRGLHYQKINPQGKLVRCLRGEIFDVAVDLRLGSNTFGKVVGEILNDINHNQLWIPTGFAHGFLCLSEIADVHYLCTDYYCKEDEKGIIWNDPDINIKWPLIDGNSDYILSEKDKAFPLLKNLF